MTNFTEADVEIGYAAMTEYMQGACEPWLRSEQMAGVRAALTAITRTRWIAPNEMTDRMKSAYGEAVYFTTDTRLLPDNIWCAERDAHLGEKADG